MALELCHTDAMELTPYVAQLRQELFTAARAEGTEALRWAQQLAAPLESAARLALLHALSAAARQISRELAPREVYVRLHGDEPEFVVTAAVASRPPVAVHGGHIRLQFADHAGAESAANLFPGAAFDARQCTVFVPYDGAVATLRTVLTSLEAAPVDVVGVSLHTGALDDLYNAITGEIDPPRFPSSRQEI
jgi:hypothetical protein